MGRVKDEKGNKHGKLLVLERAKNNHTGDAKWSCQCDCGERVVVLGKQLRRKNRPTLSCGCRIIQRNHGYKARVETRKTEGHLK